MARRTTIDSRQAAAHLRVSGSRFKYLRRSFYTLSKLSRTAPPIAWTILSRAVKRPGTFKCGRPTTAPRGPRFSRSRTRTHRVACATAAPFTRVGSPYAYNRYALVVTRNGATYPNATQWADVVTIGELRYYGYAKSATVKTCVSARARERTEHGFPRGSLRRERLEFVSRQWDHAHGSLGRGTPRHAQQRRRVRLDVRCAHVQWVEPKREHAGARNQW